MAPKIGAKIKDKKTIAHVAKFTYITCGFFIFEVISNNLNFLYVFLLR